MRAVYASVNAVRIDDRRGRALGTKLATWRSVWRRPRSEGTMLREGDRAPAVTGKAHDGRSFDLGAPGIRTVLYFYPKANTGG
jgi:hypothetical protein